MATTYTFKVEEDNPEENNSCRNSSTVPTGQLTGSSWCSPRDIDHANVQQAQQS